MNFRRAFTFAAGTLAAARIVAAAPAPGDVPPAENATGVEEAPDVVRSRELFEEATRSARRGEWAEALARFERAYALHPHAATTYNVAYCTRALGRYARAAELFERAVAEHRARGGAELSDDMLAAVVRYLAELDGRVAHVELHVAPGARVLVDGLPLDGGPELVLDAGKHVFVVSANGRDDRVVERSVTGGERTTVELDAGPPQALPSAPPVILSRPRVALRSTRAPVRGERRAPELTYATLAVGAAGLLTGAVTGIWALAERTHLEDSCVGHVCNGEDANTLDRAHTLADVATIAFVVGGLSAATGVALYVWGSPRRTERATAVTVRPWLGVATAGFKGAF